MFNGFEPQKHIRGDREALCKALGINLLMGGIDKHSSHEKRVYVLK